MTTVSKYHILEQIMTTLLEAEKRRIQGWVDRLCRQNQEAYNDPKLEGFLYQGVYYRPSWLGKGLWEKKALHSSLNDQMEVLLRGSQEIQEDRTFVRQVIYKLIDGCQTDIDIRNALPECLVSILPSLSSIPRTSEAAYTIKDNPRAMRQYEKLLPKMELYSATKMFY